MGNDAMVAVNKAEPDWVVLAPTTTGTEAAQLNEEHRSEWELEFSAHPA